MITVEFQTFSVGSSFNSLNRLVIEFSAELGVSGENIEEVVDLITVIDSHLGLTHAALHRVVLVL